MKDGIVIVDTARGAIINEAAMTAVLDSENIGAVGLLGMYGFEPKIDEAVMKNERALLIPYLGTHTTDQT